MKTLTVALGDRSYPIHVGQGLIERAELLVLRQPKAAIVSNVTVAPLYLQRLADPLRRAGVEVVEMVLPRSIRLWVARPRSITPSART